MKKNDEKSPLHYLIFFAIGLVLVIYISLIAGAYALNSDEEITLFSAFLQVPQLIQDNYKAIYPTNPEALKFGILMYILGWAFYLVQVEMNKKTMPGKEYGTAAFMTNSEIKAYRKKYMDKTIYTEGLANPKNNKD